AREALATLQRWQAWTESLPPVAALEAILEDTGLFPWTAALPAGAARAGNLVKLLEVARANGAGLSFPRLVDRLVEVVHEQELEAGSLFPGRPQAVRVMNLHRAKGLEAPVVVLAYPAGAKHHPPAFHIEREGERARGAFLIQAPSQSGLWGTPRLLGVPPGWDEAAALEERYQAAEDMRLLYVAATRARELLVISRYPAKPEKSPWHPLAFNGALDRAPVLPEPAGPAPLPDEVAVDPASVEAACHRAASAMEQARTPTSLHLAARDLIGESPARAAGETARGSLEDGAARDVSEQVAAAEHVAAALLEPGAAPQAEAAAAGAWPAARSSLDAGGLEAEGGEEPEAAASWRPDEVSEEPGGVAWGRAFHRFMELMVREGRARKPGGGSAQDSGALLAQAEALARHVAGEEGLASDKGADPARILLDWAEPLLRSELWQRVIAARRVEVEVPLALALTAGDMARRGAAAARGVAPDTPAVIQGQADLLFQEAGGWVLVDYKTDRLPAGPGRGAALAARYAPQISAYAEAWRRVTGEPVKERWLYLVRSGEAVPVP
ncbi:MAG TPA: 3'-5' exonuclease, partial [Limnochorda sp.]